ncbi:type II secretion system F family protein [Aeropyrum camini]|uniref:type II secretion system F family protein n=1 Tax=Aeropyrum camini TaxID=229980 RepID=UPI000787FF5D|nr:type II secretion system F family protein [Aeropyrum camini]
MSILDRIPLARRLRRRRQREGVYRAEVRITFSDIVDYIAYNYFSWLAVRLVKTFELERNLRIAGIPVYPVMYMSRLLLISATVFLLGAYFSFWILLSGLSIIIKALVVLLALAAPFLAFAAGLMYPSLKIGSRKSGIETELPFFAAYLSIMGRGGVPVSIVIDRVASLKIFKAMRVEAEMIKTKIKLLGKNPLDALEQHVLDSPSSVFRDFILGYTTAVKIGSDVIHYLEIRTQDLFERRLNDIRLLAERMTLYLEIYLVVAVIATIVFYIFFTISSVFPGNLGGVGSTQYASTTQLILYSFLVLPTINIIMLLLVDRARPKEPIEINDHMVALVIYSLPLALALLPIIYALSGINSILASGSPTKADILRVSGLAGLFLIMISIPPAISFFNVTRANRGIGLAMSNFLRDLAETRKTGLSPEQSIITLSSRDYGPLSRVIRRIATSLQLGMSLEDSVRRAVRRIKDWATLSALRFLVDSISVGGGSPEVLDALARYTYGLVSIQDEFRKRTRIYIIMPYLGAIIVAASTLVMLGYTIKTLQVVNPEGATAVAVVPENIGVVGLILAIGVILNSWMMGLMAGKIRRVP